MDVYSPALGLAIVAVAVSLVSAVVRRPRIGIPAGVVALVAVVVGAVSHVRVGHSPGSSSALGLTAFLAEHPALVVTAALAVGSLLLVKPARGPMTRARTIRALKASARLAAYMAVIGTLVVLSVKRGREDPIGSVVFVTAMTAVTFLTFFVFGALGYEIKGDAVRAPRILVWGFLFLLAVVALVSLLAFLT